MPHPVASPRWFAPCAGVSFVLESALPATGYLRRSTDNWRSATASSVRTPYRVHAPAARYLRHPGASAYSGERDHRFWFKVITQTFGGSIPATAPRFKVGMAIAHNWPHSPSFRERLGHRLVKARIDLRAWLNRTRTSADSARRPLCTVSRRSPTPSVSVQGAAGMPTSAWLRATLCCVPAAESRPRGGQPRSPCPGCRRR